MPMMMPDSSGALPEDVLTAMVKDQGYEAHCSAMQWTIDKNLLGNINKFFSSGTPPEESFYNGLDPTIFHGIAPYVVDLTKARIPMFRGLEDKKTTMKNSSLEGMFGANYQEAKGYLLNEAGVSERLLSSYQQCLAKVKNIVAAKKICDDVADSCTINKQYDLKIAVDKSGYSRTISDGETKALKSTEHSLDVSFKTIDLLDWFQQIRPELSDEELYQQVCFDLTGGDKDSQDSSTSAPTSTTANASVDNIAKLREAISYIPIDLDTLYRLAFLVLVPTQNKGKDGSDDFYFLQETPQADSQIHAPIFIAFKIPEFGTNKSKNVGNIDSLELTKMAIQLKEQNDKDLADQSAKRTLLYNSALAPTEVVIHCPYPKCKKPLESALIQIINGTGLHCTNDTLRIITESVGNTPSPTMKANEFGWCRNCNPPAPATQADWSNPDAEISGTTYAPMGRRLIDDGGDQGKATKKAADEYAAKYDFNLITWTFNSNNEPSGNLNEYQKVASGIERTFNQEDLNWEGAGDLFTPASKEMKSNTYKNGMNTDIASELKDIFINDFEWQLTVDQDRPELEGPMMVNAYLVLPIGENIKDVNKSLAIFWKEDRFFDMLRNNIIADMTNDDGLGKKGAIPKFYTIKDTTFGISAAEAIHPRDECHMEMRYDNKSKDWDEFEVCTSYPFGFGFSDATSKNESSSKGELMIPDFGLGYMVRKIQQTLRASFNRTYDYILSCQRVEDMFLGRCKGDPDGVTASSFCKGEAFKNIKGMPPASGVPRSAQDIFTADIVPKITTEMIEAYEYAEKTTGIPCEVVAGIHWTEAGLDPKESVFSGAALGGKSLKDDAADAMKHLIEKMWPGKFDKNNIPYEDLVTAIGNYNGPGNGNCSSDLLDNSRDTRWRETGKCPAQFSQEDHPHPTAWIDERHTDMDLIFCADFAEYSCQTLGTEDELKAIKDHINDYMDENSTLDERWSEQKIATHLTFVKEHCFSGSNVCQNLSEGRKYPKYTRPGSLTVAVLLNELGVSH